MKITNIEKGEDYNLRPDTQIQVERTNPFFNDYGEQTTPLELPASERNRRILGFPDSFGRRVKMTPTDVAIQDGEYFAQCRQVVLSAQYKGSISTSFYINDGSFYSRIQKVKLKDIFKGEFIPGVNTVEEGIAFCRKLRDNTNEQFGIFPVLLTDDSEQDTGFNYKVLNAYGKSKKLTKRHRFLVLDNGAPSAFEPDDNRAGCDFYNAVQRTEYVKNVPITLSPGYYISPFIRANYVLKRVFAYFGYELQENFFTQTEPFIKMVLVNNVIDVLVNGKIKIADLVPDITCAEFLSVFRKKFCCEFVSDEGKRTASVILFRDTIKEAPIADFTHCVTQEPVVAYKAENDYKRITLSAKEKVDSELSDTYDDMDSLVKANPTADFCFEDGAIYKTGWSGDWRVSVKIGEASQDYNTGGKLEAKEIKIPELIPEFRMLSYKTKTSSGENIYDFDEYLYIGSYVTLNSKMVVAVEPQEKTAESANKQKTMLAFNYLHDGRPEGTISSYDMYAPPIRPRIFDYALYYNGPEGIFEKFYRDYDLLLRNALHEVKVKLLLSQSQKQNLPSSAKVVIRGAPFLFNKLKFTLGGKNEPIESEFYSVSLMQPVVAAPTITEQLKSMNAAYKWVGKSKQTEVTWEEYEREVYNRNRTFITIYPPAPSAEYVGVQYGKQCTYSERITEYGDWFRHGKYKYTRTDVWLECVPV